MKLRMSFLVTRPPRPEPGTWFGSTPCSDAILATTGETKLFPSVAASAAGVAAGAAASSGSGSTARSLVAVSPSALDAAADSAAASAVAGSGGAVWAWPFAAGAPPICASFVPTSTVSPSWTTICVNVPDAGEGTSVSTLSVEISSSASSASTCSPSDFSHFVTVPSETDTPIWGITTSTAVSVAISGSSGDVLGMRGMLPEEPLILRQVSQACDYVLDLRDERLFELRRERNGCIRRGDPLYR